MVDVQALRHQRVLRRDHVVIVVMRKLRVQPVARLRRFSVADAVGKDDEIFRGIEQSARHEQHAGKLRAQELMPVAAGAVQDQHRIVDVARVRRAAARRASCNAGAIRAVFRRNGI